MMDRYVVKKSLGEGAFGIVNLAIDRETGEQKHQCLFGFITVLKVAIKTLKDKCKDVGTMLLLPEIKALRAVHHQSIVLCKEVLLDSKNNVHIVFEFVPGGNLEAFTRNRSKPFHETQIRSLFYQLLSAVNHMHSLKFLHRDIKPENILVQYNGTEDGIRIKLADLGLAIHLGDNRRPQTSYVATRWYRSPELLLKLKHYGFASDMWAVGAVMAEFISLGRPLFPGDNERDQLNKIISLRGHPSLVGWSQGTLLMRNLNITAPRVNPSSLRLSVPYASTSVLELITDLLEMDPGRRPSASKALQYPMFLSSPEHMYTSDPPPFFNRTDKKYVYGNSRDYVSGMYSDESDQCTTGLHLSILGEKRRRYTSPESLETSIPTAPANLSSRMISPVLPINYSPDDCEQDYVPHRLLKRQPIASFDFQE